MLNRGPHAAAVPRRQRPALIALAALAFAASGVAASRFAVQAIDSARPAIVMNPTSHLRTWEVGTGTRPIVVLHGYAASPQDWVPFASTIQVADDRRFIFPEAPEATTPPDGPVGGRAWWRLDLASYRRGTALPDLSRARPEGLQRASSQLRRLIADTQQRLAFKPDTLILGGFSQGAMVAAEVAFRTNEPMQALILLSPTIVDEPSWRRTMGLRRGLPVFIAHGRRDDVLPFAASERLAQAMRDAGLTVTWFPFDGIHETPTEVVEALNRFLATVDIVDRR
jgi:phospholipase/carboxylesterase